MINNYIEHNQVLDKGYINLINIMGDDKTIIDCARITKGKHPLNKDITKSEIKLIEFMIKNNHWTPFSHVTLQFHIKMPIFVARQWFRSGVGLSRNEISRRYINHVPEFYVPNNLNDSNNNKEDINYLISDMELFYEKAAKLYDKLISEGIKNEQARIILPNSLYTEFIETGTLAAYMRLYKLRSHKSSQFEITQYAHGLSNILEEVLPVTWKSVLKII